MPLGGTAVRMSCEVQKYSSVEVELTINWQIIHSFWVMCRPSATGLHGLCGSATSKYRSSISVKWEPEPGCAYSQQPRCDFLGRNF